MIAEILAMTYYDKCSVYRTEDIKVGSITRQQRVKKFEDVACALSKGSIKTTGENVSSISSVHKLFAGPTVDIQKGDEVHVVQNGRNNSIVYIADEPFYYNGSHLEVELRREDYE